MTPPTVGILSMQRVINYGSFLQAYALKKLLENNGAGKIYFLDIIPGRILVDNPVVKKNICVVYAQKLFEPGKPFKLISRIKTFLFQKRVAKTIMAAWPLLNLESKPSGTLDIVVIGSDEVFNCCQDVLWGYSTQLFGDIPTTVARKIVSYAGSFGHTDLKLLKQYGIEAEVTENLQKLDSISVRDENSASIVSQLTSTKPQIHVDPVLAYGYEKEIENFIENPMTLPYIIIFSYQGRISGKDEVDAIRLYAKLNNLKLISIFCRYDWCDKAVVPESPIEVLRWFKFADSIVTDTFHGTIFSIITKSRFATLLRPSNTNKLGYLLKVFNLDDRAANPTNISNILEKSPDYIQTYDVLKSQRYLTDKYIKEILNLS